VVAARLEKSVPPNAAYLTSTVRDVAKSSELDFEFVTHVELKGLAAPVQASALGEPAPTGARRNSWPLEGGGG
jgi:class 3 adenylate cyclase